MKSKYILGIIMILMTQTLGCGNNIIIPISGDTGGAQTPSAADPEATQPPATTIGTVSNIRTQVYAGTHNNLKLIEGETGLGNDDYVTVTDGGKARLIFPGPISLLLYNQTAMDDINLEFENNSNPRITNRLIRGGFLGQVESGNQLTIDLAFGVQVNILGTNFFILYDDKSGYLTIGKFDGTLSVTIPGQDAFFLSNAELVDIDSKGKFTLYSPIPFARTQFDKAADTCASPIQGFNILRRDNNLPQPGQNSFKESAKLPCESVLPPTPTTTPETLACETPKASVQAGVVTLRDGPDLRYFAVGVHKKGETLTILGRYHEWYQTRFSNGDKGWLHKDWITIPLGVDTQKICDLPYQGAPPTRKPNQCVPTISFSCP